MRTIQLSDETYRRLQALARPFEDKEPEDVMRRLIALVEQPAERQLSETTLEGLSSMSEPGRPLATHSGTVPHGAELRARYRGQEFYATVLDGNVVWDSRGFSSLSAAAVAVIRSAGSRRPTENGWRFWEVRVGDGEWVPGTEFRRS